LVQRFQRRRFKCDLLSKLEKRGDEIKKKSSPRKLLSQSQPNFAEMILGLLSIFSNSGHLEWRAGLSDTILKGTHPGTIPARFGPARSK
jgi:hypothetical protein